MRAWWATWRGWPCAALAFAAGSLVAAANWWTIWRSFAGDPETATLADHAGHRSAMYVGWAVIAIVGACVLRAATERRRGAAALLDRAPSRGAR